MKKCGNPQNFYEVYPDVSERTVFGQADFKKR